VEAGSNTSTVTLRVVGGDEKGSLKSETVKYGRESQGTRIRERLRWRGPDSTDSVEKKKKEKLTAVILKGLGAMTDWW
jgi:hypothetical protein